MGVVYVNTPSRYKGYVVGETKHKSLLDGWLNTGDIGYIDVNGELHISGRIDDVIIIKSHKIYPLDIETRIIANSSIVECVVVKISINDTDFTGCLYVSETDEVSIKRKLKDVMMAYEIPYYFVRCDSLPRTLNGKINRNAAQKQLMEQVRR